jgi:aryl-alcohol dehydrogenase-like predicted oxidoreductase
MFPARYKRFNAAAVQPAVARYAALAGEMGCTPAQLAYAFCKSRWYIPSTIIGATSVLQLDENLDAFGLELPEAVLTAIDDIHRQYRNPSLYD